MRALSRRMKLAAAIVAVAMAVGSYASQNARAETVLRVGMTAADIPLTVGQPDNGFEGFRFIGYVLYDALINWDLSSADKASGLTPGLAESWSVDPNDKAKWIFNLRRGVKFHDGSEFTADAVIFNFDKLMKTDSPQYDARQASLVNFRIPAVKSWRKIDDYTVEFTTKEPDSFFPYQICYILMASPAQWAKTKDWQKFAAEPSGTGPWKLDQLVPRERAELIKNSGYWDSKRVPKTDRLILFPIPEPATRTSALLSGQVDWIEAPAPDAIPRIKSAGLNVVANGYPHIWSYHLSRLPDSPWNDIRLRKAANYAIDRDGIVKLLGGYAIAAKGHVQPDDPWFGKPGFELTYDPEKAKTLLKEAGYGKDNPLKVKISISASGSGQMQPLGMNEYIQQNLAEVGIQVAFEVMEWQSLLDRWRAGAKADQNKGIHATNISYTTQDPFSSFTRFMQSDLHAPNGVNWGWYADAEMDELLKGAKTAFDPKERDTWLAKVHTKQVDDAVFVWVVHDVAPRAMHPKVKGFVQAKNWFQDLTPVYIQE